MNVDFIKPRSSCLRDNNIEAPIPGSAAAVD